jgi:hypothetical protein
MRSEARIMEQNIASWNRLVGWLRQLAGLHEAWAAQTSARIKT